MGVVGEHGVNMGPWQLRNTVAAHINGNGFPASLRGLPSTWGQAKMYVRQVLSRHSLRHSWSFFPSFV